MVCVPDKGDAGWLLGCKRYWNLQVDVFQEMGFSNFLVGVLLAVAAARVRPHKRAESKNIMHIVSSLRYLAGPRLWGHLDKRPPPCQRPLHETKEDGHDCRAHDDNVIRHRKIWSRHVQQQPTRVYPISPRTSGINRRVALAFVGYADFVFAEQVEQCQRSRRDLDSTLGVRSVFRVFEHEFGEWDLHLDEGPRWEGERQVQCRSG